MIIVVRYDHRAYTTLCEEVRRTDKRIYVRYVAGDTYVSLSGRRDNQYVDIADVMTDTGTPEQFVDVKRFVDTHNDKMREAERALSDERRGFTAALREIVSKQ